MAEHELRAANSRWWENYLVRYFVGSVVGAGIVVFLNTYCGSPFYGVLPSRLEDASFKEVAIVASVGFAFCYVASAPILTAHGTRDHLRLSEIRRYWPVWIVVPLLATGAAWYFLSNSRPFSNLGAVAFGVTVGFQVVLLVAALSDRLSSIFLFYSNLSAARSNQASQISEYVESYRHLREHGNAFSILLAEVTLGFILVSLPSKLSSVPVFFIWMLPASACWLIGTILESRLAYAPRRQ